jgi:SAM-dependent methyltransferase
MAHDAIPRPAGAAIADPGHQRWDELLGNIADLLPARGAAVLIDGGPSETVADRLAARLAAAGRPCHRLTGAANGGFATGTITLADGPRWRSRRHWDIVIWLRTPPGGADTHPHGEAGADIALDLTPEMLAHARAQGRAAYATLVVGDARCLPLAGASVDAVFAAGLIMHLPDPQAGLGQLARVTRRGGLLILFHPSGRAALAARHGRTLRPDEPLAEAPLRHSTRRAGWRLTTYDEADCRFLAVAIRE